MKHLLLGSEIHEDNRVLNATSIELDVAGLGIIFYCASAVEHIKKGEDYYSASFITEEDVQRHVQSGRLTGFGTGSPGRYILRFHSGYPDDTTLAQSQYKLRLGFRSDGSRVFFRDMFDLLCWEPSCPSSQSILLAEGVFHVTLVSNDPQSGIVGDNQIIDIYVFPLDSFPRLKKTGVPMLYS
jgi:hypothetical protein